MKVVRKMRNWKAPGPDNVQGYLLKNLTPLHDTLMVHLEDWLGYGVITEWLAKRRTVLMQKDKTKGNIASNYRPITCLPLVWKSLTGVLAGEVYDYLERKRLLPEEQRGYRRPTSKGQVIREVQIRTKNLAVAWIGYKKGYDMVPISWIVESLGIVGVSEQIKNILSDSTKARRVDLICGDQSLGGVVIN